MKRCFEQVREEYLKFPTIETHLPERADAGACAYDFYSKEYFELAPGQSHIFWTDVKALMYFDNRLDINTRSGNGSKHGIVLANTIGYIDASYYGNSFNDGNIGICLKNTGDSVFIVSVGDRIAQGSFTHYLITDDDKFKNDNTNQPRNGGFGSTGK